MKKLSYEERQQQTATLIEDNKRELAARHGLARDAKFDIAYQIAWDRGHCHGFGEIEYCFEEMLPLLK